MPGETTDAVKERIDIAALIQESLPLKRAGSNFKARCPFHEEDTPSFVVSPTRQTFHCFGCGVGGDVFSWLMKREGMSFPEALRVLAQRAGVPLTFDRPERREERDRLRATLDLAATFYQRILAETADGQASRAYLTERGLAQGTVAAWRLGFCPPAATGIVAKARERGVELADLVQTGVVGQREGRTFEFFRGRIVFPLADHHGSVIGLAGRVFGDERPDRPKYINTAETLLYKKGTVLYGLDRAKDAIRKEGVAVLVEGYTDVIASHQAGVTHVVATSGTALTYDHLRLLRRFTDRLAFAFDADAAGDQATRRAVDLALAAGFSVSVVVLPSGDDPADLAVRDPGAWQRALAGREDVFPFLLRRALGLHDPATAEGKRAIASDLLSVIALIQDGVVRGGAVQQLAAALRVDERFVMEDLGRVRQSVMQGTASGPGRAAAPEAKSPLADARVRREERFLALLLAEPSLIPRVAEVLPGAAFLTPQTQALYEGLGTWYARSRESGAPLSFDALPPLLPDDVRPRLDALRLAVDMERETDEWRPAPEAAAILRDLLRDSLRRDLQAHTERLRAASGTERQRLLEAMAGMTAELARAERVTLA